MEKKWRVIAILKHIFEDNFLSVTLADFTYRQKLENSEVSKENFE